MMQTFLEQLGGPDKLQEIVDTFVDRVVDDVMIGFFFREVDVARLKKMEFLFAAQFLGGDFRYTGKPLPAAHRKHPIMGGHFARRKQILMDVLIEFEVAEDVRNAWLKHTDSLRASITKDQDNECQDSSSAKMPWET
jgi:hemoglobin